MAIDNAAINTAIATFRQNPAFAPYDTLANFKAVAEHANSIWGARGATTPGSFEIAFHELVAAGKIQKNPRYVNPNFRAEADALPASELKLRYLSDPEFKRQYDAS